MYNQSWTARAHTDNTKLKGTNEKNPITKKELTIMNTLLTTSDIFQVSKSVYCMHYMVATTVCDKECVIYTDRDS